MNTFAQTGRLTRGYHPEQVDRFFAHARATYEGRLAEGTKPLTAREVRVVGFDLVRGGYDVLQVDAALDRLEDVLARRERDAMRRAEGDEAVAAEARNLARELMETLTKPDGARFPKPEAKDKGYDAEDVDALCAQLIGYFEHAELMSADDVRLAVFSRAKGEKAYAEGPVDDFCDRVIEVMVLSD